ncbi:hypothetical protein B0H12DRAFT_1078796 [Mycena haematopus]|nr:hypothetical protein B0H12DRAFT_1078796 [Mycena haematopus]
MNTYFPNQSLVERSRTLIDYHPPTSRSSDHHYSVEEQHARRVNINVHNASHLIEFLPPDPLQGESLYLDSPSSSLSINFASDAARSTWSLASSERDVQYTGKSGVTSGASHSSPDLVRPPPLRTRQHIIAYQPVEYHPEPILYAYQRPPDLDEDQDTQWMMIKLAEWREREEAVKVFHKKNPHPIIPVRFPEFIWHEHNEDVHSLKGPTHCLLHPGDLLDCYELIRGDWRITDRVERRHQWRAGVRKQLEEWVYLIIQNEKTRRETWLKVEAQYYAPTTVGVTIRRSLQKIRSLFDFKSVQK